ncbi:MAG: pre-peptidase C-terminal domain-containing protein, partial [Myxococcota bacterium]|nr:pre-peptidase C-terminal domain-containing protein [Myxococcota bacterium]
EMTPGDTHTHSLPSGDEDYIVFYIDRRLDVTLETSGGSGDTELYLYTENYSQITFDDQGGINSFSKINEVLEAGVYFAKVKSGGWAASDIYTYNLSLTTTEPLAPGPTNLVASMDGQVVNLSWNAAADAETYNVYYGQTPGGPYTGGLSTATEGASPINTASLTQTLTDLSQSNTFYIVVTGVAADGTETYPSTEVDVTIPLLADAFEPDDSFETAQLIEPGVQQEHSCHIADDEDYVFFELTAWKNNIIIETSGPQSVDTKLYLYDSTFTQINYTDDGGTSLFSRIEMNDLTAGTYYAMARPFGSFSTYGAYWIDLSVVEIQPPSTTPDAFEDDNTVETASTLTAGEAQARSIHQDGDVDFVQFTLDSVSDIVLATTAENGDTVLTVMDSEQNELAKDDTADAMSTIELNALQPGTYYASVSSQGTPQLLENYELELTVYAHPAPPQNLVTTAGPGSITLSWDASENAASYIIQYEYSNEAPFETVSAVEGASPLTTLDTSFVFTGLPSDAPTYFCVVAVNGSAQSECSALVAGTSGEAAADGAGD